jgi:hypothetical protein
MAIDLNPMKEAAMSAEVRAAWQGESADCFLGGDNDTV